MKKLFSSIVFALMCINMSAATTILFDGKQALNWSEGLKIDAEKFEHAHVGDIITVTTDNGGFKLAVFSPWKVLMENGVSGEGYTITDEVFEAIKADGIHVQGGTDVNVLKVEISSDAPQPTEKTIVATLFNETHKIGNWDNTLELLGSKFEGAGVKEGDYVRINYNTNGDAQIQLCANNPSWHNIYECANLPSSKKVFDFLLTAEVLSDIEADKLYIQGKNFTISSVQIVRENAATAINGVNIKSNRSNNAMYSIDGRRLYAVPLHGIYIINGKKHVVR